VKNRVRPNRADPPIPLRGQWLPGAPGPGTRAPKSPLAAPSRGLGPGSGDDWPGWAAGAPPALADETGGTDAGELAGGRGRPVARGVGAAAGTVAAATGELAGGAPAARLTWAPWLGIIVTTTATAAAARTRSVTDPASTPVRKLTSSSLVLTAARKPGHEPTVR
jgi:hypothetical protein